MKRDFFILIAAILFVVGILVGNTRILAPIHEIGHVIGGLFSNTGVKLIAWDECVTYPDSNLQDLIVTLSGYFVGSGLLFFLFSLVSKWYIMPFFAGHIIGSIFMALAFDTYGHDFSEMPAMAFIFIIYAFWLSGMIIRKAVKRSKNVRHSRQLWRKSIIGTRARN